MRSGEEGLTADESLCVGQWKGNIMMPQKCCPDSPQGGKSDCKAVARGPGCRGGGVGLSQLTVLPQQNKKQGHPPPKKSEEVLEISEKERREGLFLRESGE